MATLKQLLADMRRFNEGMQKLDEAAPRIAGVEAVKWVRKNFTNQSYKGRKWKPRSPKTNKAYDRRSGVKGSVFNSSNPILRQSGNLMDAQRYRVVNRTTYIGFDTNRIPYGVIHNEGGTIHVRMGARRMYFYKGRFAAKMKGTKRKGKDVGATNIIIKMPQRQFMPKPNESPDPDLLHAASEKINFEREKLFAIFKK